MKTALAIILASAFVVISLAEEPKGTTVKLDSFTSTTPAEWKSEKPWNRLRSHQFKLPGVKDAKAAEVFIFPDLTKTPEENFARYKEMFQVPEGKTADDLSKVDKLAVGTKIKCHVLDMKGTLLHKDRPFDPKAKIDVLPESRVISIIMESPDGNFLIRLWGPQVTVDHHEKAFRDWLKAFK